MKEMPRESDKTPDETGLAFVESDDTVPDLAVMAQEPPANPEPGGPDTRAVFPWRGDYIVDIMMRGG